MSCEQTIVPIKGAESITEYRQKLNDFYKKNPKYKFNENELRELRIAIKEENERIITKYHQDLFNYYKRNPTHPFDENTLKIIRRMEIEQDLFNYYKRNPTYPFDEKTLKIIRRMENEQGNERIITKYHQDYSYKRNPTHPFDEKSLKIKRRTEIEQRNEQKMTEYRKNLFNHYQKYPNHPFDEKALNELRKEIELKMGNDTDWITRAVTLRILPLQIPIFPSEDARNLYYFRTLQTTYGKRKKIYDTTFFRRFYKR